MSSVKEKNSTQPATTIDAGVPAQPFVVVVSNICDAPVIVGHSVEEAAIPLRAS